VNLGHSEIQVVRLVERKVISRPFTIVKLGIHTHGPFNIRYRAVAEALFGLKHGFL
jgi:hypothetical protein